MTRTIDLSNLLDVRLGPDDLAEEHALDVSATVWARMQELGISKSELARKMGVSPSRVTKIIKGECNLTIRTIAKLECALGLNLCSGFAPAADAGTTVTLTSNSSYEADAVGWAKPTIENGMKLGQGQVSLKLLKGGLEAA